MFGFGNDEEEYQQQREQPREKSFLSKIGSFLWTAVKWAAVAVAAVATLGAVFNWSPSARNFVDGFTGGKDGDGKGLGSWFSNLFTNAKNKVSDWMSPTPNPNDVAETKTNKAGVPYLEALPALTDNPLVKDPKQYALLKDLTSAYSNLKSASVTDPDALATRDKLKEQRREATRFAETIEAWNASVDDFKKKNPNGLTPPRIELEIPALTPALIAYGKSKQPSLWADATKGTTIAQIKYLEAQLGSDFGSDKDLPLQAGRDYLLKPNGVVRDFITAYDNPKANIADIVNSYTAGTAFGRFVGSDKALDEQSQGIIAGLIERGKLNDAKIIASVARERFEELRAKLDTDGKTDLKDKGVEYTKARDNFGKIIERIDVIQAKSDFDVVGHKFNAHVIRTAESTPIIFAEYKKTVEGGTTQTPTETAPVVQPAPTTQAAPSSATVAPPTGTDPAKLKAALKTGIKARDEKISQEDGGRVAPKAGLPSNASVARLNDLH